MEVYIVRDIYDDDMVIFSAREYAEAYLNDTFDPAAHYIDIYEVVK